MSVLLVYSTVPDADTGARIARTLVDERLAACVSVLPGLTSTYRWQDAVHVDAELLLMAKTTRERHDALAARLLELHPYELPEIIAVEAAAGHASYLAWVARQTQLA
ncbi:divalent-cation tolerance protein CutA [Dokdonella sp. MW10]|uniref:divalent-cation tolerance protein CutA n=1 Tax=Dokdonella sp. MW10 TaxID=2992926 RepID=UPI003F7DD737